MKKAVPVLLAAGAAAFTLASCSSDGSSAAHDPTPAGPNILFVIMDDVGIDQMASFGYGGAKPPHMPNMDAVAAAGVRFRNTWSMPECSPGRAAFFVGRYPFRTHINQAIGPSDLATSHLSPYDTTTPKLLKQANYENAMFGKFHLAGPENNEAGTATPSVLGWDYFYGWVGGLPGSIDTSAGGVAPGGSHMCGFVPGRLAKGGTDTGACYQPDHSCALVTRTSLAQDSAGLQCLDAGGILVPNTTCGTPPASLAFERENGYYVSPLVIIKNGEVEEVPLTDTRARGYRTRIETDAAIDWIRSRSPDKAWMATVSYSAAHTPWQQPPGSLLHDAGGAASDAWNCTDTTQGRLIQDHMTQAMDTEFGRLLVETGIAKRNQDGSLNYDPKATNTVIVIVGDNGSLGNAVKPPFIPSQAKGTAYQTGVWDPLIIAGPQVVQPDREVEHMVNTVDLFQFFGELAGIDVHKEVPRTVDSVGILPYLSTPEQPSLRTINFTMGGINQQANGGRNGPCVINNTTCTQIPTSKSVCEDNLGVWWGADYTDPSVVDNGGAGYPICAEVNRALVKADRPMLSILPETSMAIRNDRYKLVRNVSQVYVPATDTIDTQTEEELFEVNQAAPVPLLDTPDRNLLPATTTETQTTYNDLLATLDKLLASNPDCPGDGNMDGVVNAADLENWQRIAHEWGQSSVYDFVINGVRDGLTNTADASVIQNNLGKSCERTYGIY
ncbi:sulfatase-like hydrolase/transferase [Verticiella sediminum]|uniref:Sulfatase-like hydrolase/transferase n=1 Tax=Verticiella sediminum TaxID=1247510 RepID=A0A556ACJ5_9BURK|nr:sulfatase-like hydrolase/transferase [Verticiella sediminum]TSH90614.1 sulfatase-like hydrolase/transferase [Verticiella sediminum]